MINLIEQWGAGFQKLNNQLKDYPEIEVKYLEPGLSFQVQFVKNSLAETGNSTEVIDSDQAGTKSGLSWDYVGTMLGISRELVDRVLSLCNDAKSLSDLMLKFEFSNKSKFKAKYINPLLDLGFIELSIPGKPKSPNQKYLTTSKGKIFLQTLTK